MKLHCRIERTIDVSAEKLCERIFDTENWKTFEGWGLIPGIDSARYVLKTSNWVGSRIEVKNRDKTTHIEEITEYVSGKSLTIKLHEFSLPVKALVTHFIERWTFFSEPSGKTRVIREMDIFPAHSIASPLLWVVSRLLKRALENHLEKLAGIK